MIAYAISDPSTLDFSRLEEDLERFSKKASMLVYRDKKNPDYTKHASLFISVANGFDKVLLHSDYLLAHKLRADGVHLKSTQFLDIKKAKSLGLFVIVSTHTLEEALIAESLGVDMLTFSPIFFTPNKGLPVGLEALKSVVHSVSIPVLAMGGILTQEQIVSCEDVGAGGFASIRYFL